MIRLSLHVLNQDPAVSIHLRPGQSCTVGSSAAADYCISDAAIDAVHCRVICQISGGYIECFETERNISVNGTRKNRSRLADADELKLGSTKLTVKLPREEMPELSFSVDFGSEQPPSTLLSPIISKPRRETEDSETVPDNDDVAEPDAQTSAEGLIEKDLPQSESANAQMSSDGVASESAAANGDASNGDVLDFDDDLPPSPVAPVAASEEPNSTATTIPPKSHQLAKGSPVFEFDSTEPKDAPLSEEDLATLNDENVEQVTLGRTDLESEVAGSEPAASAKQLAAPAESKTEGDSKAPFPGGADMVKYWKWTGSSAIELLNSILTGPADMTLYESTAQGIVVSDLEGEVDQEAFLKRPKLVLLVSRESLNELTLLTHRKRWEDRIGHPQAVAMFMALSPKRIVNDFLTAVEACVTVADKEVELYYRKVVSQQVTLRRTDVNKLLTAVCQPRTDINAACQAATDI